MAYSDYGAYIWRKKDGSWERFVDGEDTNINNFISNNPPPKHRPLEAATGLKLDVLLHADGMQKDSDWHLEHAHHGVIGNGYVIVTIHKQWLDSIKVGETVHPSPKRVDIHKLLPNGYTLSLMDNPTGVCVHLSTPDGEWMAYVGYGVGSHWWQDAGGYALSYKSDYTRRELPHKHYPTANEALEFCIQKFGI